jgi:hypothetical protein
MWPESFRPRLNKVRKVKAQAAKANTKRRGPVVLDGITKKEAHERRIRNLIKEKDKEIKKYKKHLHEKAAGFLFEVNKHEAYV